MEKKNCNDEVRILGGGSHPGQASRHASAHTRRDSLVSLPGFIIESSMRACATGWVPLFQCTSILYIEKKTKRLDNAKHTCMQCFCRKEKRRNHVYETCGQEPSSPQETPLHSRGTMSTRLLAGGAVRESRHVVSPPPRKPAARPRELWKHRAARSSLQLEALRPRSARQAKPRCASSALRVSCVEWGYVRDFTGLRQHLSSIRGAAHTSRGVIACLRERRGGDVLNRKKCQT